MPQRHLSHPEFGTVPTPGSLAGTRGPTTTNARKAALAAFLGSMLEYYDFFVYGLTAALVFPTLFFQVDDPTVATVLSLSSFGIAYVARPLGAFVLGHFGDRIGRKKVMVFTLLLMGVASLAIGFLPTYHQVGALAPILLVVLRLAQGFSAGGEAAGASTLTLEHSPRGRRAFFTSFAMSGFAGGMVLANIVFLPVAALPDEALYSWGWRVPFWVSVLVIAVAYVVRRRLDETPVFVAEQEKEAVAAVPVVELFHRQGSDVVRVMAISLFSVFQSLFAVWSLSYASSDAVGLDRSAMLWVSVAANATAVIALPAMAALSDRVGRRPVWIVGAVGCTLLLPLYLWAISAGSYPLVFVTGVLFAGVVYSAVNGLWPAFFSETFAAPVRYSGFAIGSQFGFLIGGFAPAIAAGLAGDGPWGWLPVAVLAGGCGLVSAIAMATARETYRTPLDELGLRRRPSEPTPAPETAMAR
ncbi:MFS transporter [Georgenia ruanii]|uniref:MFS transporter n=1 Tax=Georgenia ruanii TaxID=348442 RepID=A0A7J9UWN5_9MICO|nr:MFS transporter [Georgenia ruanii]MPV89028.1 MFS transporter [Georgenia ruanii]